MPDQYNIELFQAQAGDRADPVLDRYSVVERVRSLRTDQVDGQPLALIPTELDLTVNPTTTDTIVLGGETYEFVTASGAVANDANIAVEIGGDAAASFANLLAAINGSADEAHANITNVATTEPALGRGSQPVFGGAVDTNVLGVYYTAKQGLDPATMTHADYARVPAAYPSYAVSSSLTSAAVFSFLNFNLMPLVNPVRLVNGMVAMRLAVVTAIIGKVLRFTFAGGTAILGCFPSPKSATGVLLDWDAVTYQVTGGELLINLTTAGTIDPADGDFVDIIVVGDFTGAPTPPAVL